MLINETKEEPITTFEIGEPFPIQVPLREGAVMELWGWGLVVMIQLPGVSRNERRAFHKKFKRYSYLEFPSKIPVAVWVFEFPGMGTFEVTFNAKIVEREFTNNFLDTNDGIKNGLHFFLLDGQILKAMKAVGLSKEAMKLFHDTIRKQLAMDYDMTDFGNCVAGVYTKGTRELFEMGQKFHHK